MKTNKCRKCGFINPETEWWNCQKCGGPMSAPDAAPAKTLDRENPKAKGKPAKSKADDLIKLIVTAVGVSMLMFLVIGALIGGGTTEMYSFFFKGLIGLGIFVFIPLKLMSRWQSRPTNIVILFGGTLALLALLLIVFSLI